MKTSEPTQSKRLRAAVARDQTGQGRTAKIIRLPPQQMHPSTPQVGKLDGFLRALLAAAMEGFALYGAALHPNARYLVTEVRDGEGCEPTEAEGDDAPNCARKSRAGP